MQAIYKAKYASYLLKKYMQAIYKAKYKNYL